MKILILSTKNLENYYVHAYESWKKYLSKITDIKYYGEGYDNFCGWNINAHDLYKKINFYPDLELWCGGPGNKKPQYITGDYILKNQIKQIPKLILITDFWEIIRDSNIETWKKREEILEQYGVIGYFSFYSQAKEWYNNIVKTKFKIFIIFSYIYENIFSEDINLEKKWDVNLQLNNNGYPFRKMIFDYITKNTKYNFFYVDENHKYKIIKGDNDPLNKLFKRNNPSSNYSALVNSSYITIADGYTKYCPYKNIWKLPNSDLFLARYSQVLASSSVLFCPKIKENINNLEKLIDGIHYIAIDETNYKDKLNFYLKNKELLKNISQQANVWAKNNCHGITVLNKFYKDLQLISSK